MRAECSYEKLFTRNRKLNNDTQWGNDESTLHPVRNRGVDPGGHWGSRVAPPPPHENIGGKHIVYGFAPPPQ